MKTTKISKGETVVIESGAILIIANQSFTVKDTVVMGVDNKPVTIKTLVPAKCV